MLVSSCMSGSPSIPDPVAPTPTPALARALRRALRPLVRLMLAHGLTLPYLLELLKSLLVEVADREFRIGDKSPTDSRVSLVTGVHRKDVGRLRQRMAHEGHDVPAVVSLGARLVALWQGAAPYLDESGAPLALPRFVSEGGPASFEGLVASINSDIRSRVVLDEWLRSGLVRLDEKRHVCLNAEAFVPAEGSDEKAFYLGQNLHDHAAAAAHNMLGRSPPFLERSVHYGSLPRATVDALARQAEALGMKALLAVNKTALAQERAPPDTAAPRQRMTFGIYFYSEPAAPEQPVQTDLPGAEPVRTAP